jgi:hypothetical protein
LLVVAVLALLFVAYLRLSRTVIVGSDGGTVALQGWDMLHGSVLLHGWTVADVSFYTTELPEYALLERLSGLGPDVVHIAGALTYTILVLLACLLAKGRASGTQALVRLLIAGGIMLAPAPGFGTSTLLLTPDHVGSTVPVLLAWLAVDRCQRRWYVPAAVGVILAWGLIADPLIEVTGVAPLVIIGGFRAAQRARHREPWWFEATLAAAAVVAVGLAALASVLIRAAGGFAISPVQTSFAGFGALPHNASLAGEGLLLLFGVSFIGGQPVHVVFSVLHLVSVGAVLIAFCVALRRFFRRDEMLCQPAGGRPPAPPDDLVVQALAVAIALNVALYVLGRYPVDPLSTREISEVLPLGAALAGQVLGGPALFGTLLASRLRMLFPVLAAVLAGYAVSLGAYAAQPAVPALHQDLAGWLVAHHLRSGLAPTYWLANITTTDSGGRSRVVQVSLTDGAVTRPDRWETNGQWYQPASNSANFLVTDTTPGSAAWQSAVASARRTFGPPVSIRSYRQYTIMIWNRNVLRFLR